MKKPSTTQVEVRELRNMIAGMPPVSIRRKISRVAIPDTVTTQDQAVDFVKALPEYAEYFVGRKVSKVVFIPGFTLNIILEPNGGVKNDPDFTDDEAEEIGMDIARALDLDFDDPEPIDEELYDDYSADDVDDTPEWIVETKDNDTGDSNAEVCDSKKEAIAWFRSEIEQCKADGGEYEVIIWHNGTEEFKRWES